MGWHTPRSVVTGEKLTQLFMVRALPWIVNLMRNFLGRESLSRLKRATATSRRFPVRHGGERQASADSAWAFLPKTKAMRMLTKYRTIMGAAITV